MLVLLAGMAIGMLLVMIAAWFYQRAAGNGGWIDVFWSFGTGGVIFAALLADGAAGFAWRRLCLMAIIAIWSLRLGGHIASRVRSHPEDARYNAMRRDWGADFNRRLFRFALIQAPVSALLGLAVLAAARQQDSAPTVCDFFGLFFLVLAMAGEGLADRQLRSFKADPAHRGLVCDRGLWALTRHPNYLFEALFWIGFPIMAFPKGDIWALLAWAAPIAMGLALRFGTGVPPLEAAMLRSKGELYRRYQEKVPVFLPFFPPTHRPPNRG